MSCNKPYRSIKKGGLKRYRYKVVDAEIMIETRQRVLLLTIMRIVKNIKK